MIKKHEGLEIVEPYKKWTGLQTHNGSLTKHKSN